MDNLQKPFKGIHTDNLPQEQPKETYRFALNALDGNSSGLNSLSVEESNAIADTIGTSMIPIGKIYMSNNRQTIFLVSEDETVSEFGILDKNDNYTPEVNDSTSPQKDKLGFKISKQIQGYYRLRRGCEDTIYFTDYNTRPKYYNYGSKSDFKNPDGSWNTNLFFLQKTYTRIPSFEDITVLDSGGSLQPGSYNVAVQLVDESLNPTDWIVTSEIIKIYNDLPTKNYPEIAGSINSQESILNFPRTSKAIEIDLGSSLDTDFLYYRLAFIEASSGSGEVNEIKVSDVIPTKQPKFVYTGSNAVDTISEPEVLAFNNIIEKAKTIIGLENRLIVGGTAGKDVNYCSFQKYFSKVKADCVYKEVSLSDIKDPSNPKNPTHEYDGIGYMPGEIYSFAGHFVFDDGEISPGFHIPGKNFNLSADTMFTEGGNVLPMSIDNQIETKYTDDDGNCYGGSYWGLDSEGEPLVGKNVRHHRFPLRKEVNLPLIESTSGEVQTTEYYKVQMTVSGELITPVPCPDTNPDCGDDIVYDFSVRITYTVDGEEFTFSQNIDPNFYASNQSSYVIEAQENSNFHGSNNIVITKVEVTDINGNFENVVFTGTGPDINANYSNTNYFVTNPATITTTSILSTGTVQGRNYTAKIMGIKFSGIELPTEEDTNGRKIIGYVITRQERNSFNKTILDSAVLTPTVENEKYISHGLLCPETDKLNKKVFGMITPEHKFKNTELNNFDEVIQEGNYIVDQRFYGKVTYNDVYDGTSYDGGDKHKDGNDDGHPADGEPDSRGLDGWSFDLISRDNIVNFKKSNEFTLSKEDIEDVFYLNPLEDRSINDYANTVFNVTTDNKIGILHTKNEVITPRKNSLPYVVLKRKNLQAYANFRVGEFIKQGREIYLFDENNESEESVVYGGDTYISPMRYHNTVYYDNRVARRQGRGGVLNIILGAALAVLGAVLVATGAFAGAGVLVIGAGITIIGGATLIASSGLKQESYNKAYAEEYDKGLRKTAEDNWVDAFYNYKDGHDPNGAIYTDGIFGFTGNGGGGVSGPSDDSIQWITDCVTDLYFETSINTSLRTKMAEGDTPTYLNSPGVIESGNNDPINTWDFFDQYYTSSVSRYPVSRLERHVVRQLLAFDDSRNANKYYIGLALPEFYNINKDYERINRQKLFYLLPLEYDCCSDCQEDFPQRWHYSEQSFQEELSDNFRVFLPNNYRDIPGETGRIMNIFSIGENLFIHTEEALWLQPKNYQERVTDQIVSFIGTGSYAEIPPRKILDDKNGSSAGLKHQWGAINTKQGYFFISEAEGKFYMFNGKSLVPLSSLGNYHWFRENIPMANDEQYFKIYNEEFPCRDNPSNKLGTGFVLGYDNKHDRILITKKDYKLQSVYDAENLITVCGNQTISFPNYKDIILHQTQLGYDYVGLEDCEMKFKKTVLQSTTENRTVTTTVPNKADIVVQFDTSGSFTPEARDEIKLSVQTWLADFQTSNPEWEGNLYFFESASNAGESWMKALEEVLTTTNVNGSGFNYLNTNLNTLDLVLICFTNEASPVYHGSDAMSTIPNPTTTFTTHYNDFKTYYNQLNSFQGITYPVVFSGSYATTNAWTRAFLQHQLAAFKGVNYTQAEAEAIPVNSGFTATQWADLLTSLQGVNPYDINGLENFNWKGVWDVYWDGNNQIVSTAEFQENINTILEGSSSTEVQSVEVFKEVTEIKKIPGEVITPTKVDNSWTRSFALKNEFRNYYSWTSFHSYLPSMYISGINKLYSWSYQDTSNIYKHNIDNTYRTFYGELYPYIIELVSNSSPVVNRTWEFIKLFTRALEYNEEYEDYVENRYITFNKLIAYNENQCSGELNLRVKDTEGVDANYLIEQVQNTNQVTIDRNEKEWTINELRDYRESYDKPIWNKALQARQDEYYIDKVLNTLSLNLNKSWDELESFRGKYLIVRLIFDKFVDTNLICSYSSENENPSVR